MTDGPTSDLDALSSILAEAHMLLSTITLPQGRAERARSFGYYRQPS